MKIKFKLDTYKAARATVAIAASYGLRQVSEGTKYPQLAFANSIAYDEQSSTATVQLLLLRNILP